MTPVDVSLLRPYRWAVSDNHRWERFECRPGDIFVCTPPKCGTTWMQTILASLLWPDGDVPGQVMTISSFVKVRISGHEFDHVRAEPAPEMAERVAAAMAAKYWSDLLIRFARHPLTVRLSVPVP